MNAPRGLYRWDDAGLVCRRRWPETGHWASDREERRTATRSERGRDDEREHPRGDPRHPRLSDVRSRPAPGVARTAPGTGSGALSCGGLLAGPGFLRSLRVGRVSGQPQVGGGAAEGEACRRQDRRQPDDDCRRGRAATAWLLRLWWSQLSGRENSHGHSGCRYRSTEGLSTQMGRDPRAQGRNDVDRAQGYSPSTLPVYHSAEVWSHHRQAYEHAPGDSGTADGRGSRSQLATSVAMTT